MYSVSFLAESDDVKVEFIYIDALSLRSRSVSVSSHGKCAVEMRLQQPLDLRRIVHLTFNRVSQNSHCLKVHDFRTTFLWS